MTRLPRVLAVLGVGIAVAAAPTTALAHALNPTYESQLPLVVYLAGAGLAVALSFAFVLVRDLRAELPPKPDGSPRFPAYATPVSRSVAHPSRQAITDQRVRHIGPRHTHPGHRSRLFHDHADSNVAGPRD